MSFDIRRFLTENKLTKASKAIVNENTPGFNPFMDAVDDYISMNHPRYEELQRAVEDALHSGELHSRPLTFQNEPGSHYEQVAQIAKELGIEDSNQDDFVHTMPGYKDVMDALDNITIRESQHPQEIETEGGLLGILIGDVNGTPIYSVEDSSIRDTMVYVVGEEIVAIEVDGEMVPGAIIYAEYGQTEEVSEFLAQDIANELGVEYQSYPYGDINPSGGGIDQDLMENKKSKKQNNVSFDLNKFLTENKLTVASRRLSENNFYVPAMEEESMEDQPMEQDVVVDVEEKEDTYNPSKYESVEELMKEIEVRSNKAALQEKMKRVKEAYESLEQKASSLEEGEDSKYISSAKLKEMKKGAKSLRKMYEKYEKEYESRYSEQMKPKKKMNEQSSLTSIIREEIRLLKEASNIADNPYYDEEFRQAESLLLKGLTQVLGNKAGWVDEAGDDGELYAVPSLVDRESEIFFAQERDGFYIGVTSDSGWFVKPTKVEVENITSTTIALATKYRDKLASQEDSADGEDEMLDADEAQRLYHNKMVKFGHRKGPIFSKKNFRQEYEKYIKSVQ